MLNVAMVGLGYWGNNLLRNFLATPEVRVVALCDLRPDILAAAREKAPQAAGYADYGAMLAGTPADAVVVATPAKTHFPFARDALAAGRHVLLEKPATGSLAEMRELAALAAAGNRVLHIDHTPIFPYSVDRLKAAIADERERTGRGLRTLSSVRMGPYALRDDVHIVADVAIHDLALFDHLLDGRLPDTLSVLGRRWLPDWPVAEAVVNLSYGDTMATVHVGWMCAEKRQLIRANFGDCLAMYEEPLAADKLRIYRMVPDTERRLPDQYRYTLERVPGAEPPPGETLARLCAHFRDCIAGRESALSGAAMGLRLAAVLEAADASLAAGGALVEVARP